MCVSVSERMRQRDGVSEWVGLCERLLERDCERVEIADGEPERERIVITVAVRERMCDELAALYG